jgi:hypothetical protein
MERQSSAEVRWRRARAPRAALVSAIALHGRFFVATTHADQCNAKCSTTTITRRYRTTLVFTLGITGRVAGLPVDNVQPQDHAVTRNRSSVAAFVRLVLRIIGGNDCGSYNFGQRVQQAMTTSLSTLPMGGARAQETIPAFSWCVFARYRIDGRSKAGAGFFGRMPYAGLDV